jgi:hypothetical protein
MHSLLHPLQVTCHLRNILVGANFDAMDTNKNGKLDKDDDPFSPFYPGDEYVDVKFKVKINSF